MGHSGDAANSSELKRSCEECSSSKVKCSQDKPICKRCRKHHIECTYTPPKRTGRPRKITKDGSGSQSRIIRPLASAPQDNDGRWNVALAADHPSSGNMVEQDMTGYNEASHHVNDLFGPGSVELAAIGAGDRALLSPAYELLDHEWPGNIEGSDTFWGTGLGGQPCGQSDLDDGHAQFRNHSLAAEQYDVVQEMWRQQFAMPRSMCLDAQAMYSDSQIWQGEHGQLAMYDQDAFVGTS